MNEKMTPKKSHLRKLHVFLALSFLISTSIAEDMNGVPSNDPDIDLNTPQTIRKNGYPAETHTVQTADGYLLAIHRIPGGLHSSTNDPISLTLATAPAVSSSTTTDDPNIPRRRSVLAQNVPNAPNVLNMAVQNEVAPSTDAVNMHAAATILPARPVQRKTKNTTKSATRRTTENEIGIEIGIGTESWNATGIETGTGNGNEIGNRKENGSGRGSAAETGGEIGIMKTNRTWTETGTWTGTWTGTETETRTETETVVGTGSKNDSLTSTSPRAERHLKTPFPKAKFNGATGAPPLAPRTDIGTVIQTRPLLPTTVPSFTKHWAEVTANPAWTPPRENSVNPTATAATATRYPPTTTTTTTTTTTGTTATATSGATTSTTTPTRRDTRSAAFTATGESERTEAAAATGRTAALGPSTRNAATAKRTTTTPIASATTSTTASSIISTSMTNQTTPPPPQPPRPVVFLQHGLLGSSYDWILAGPGKALAYLLADAGFDVWMGNARGNTYSRAHVYLPTEPSSSFWDFSFHEMGIYDLPAEFEHILNVTGAPYLHYIGHSMGTTMFFVLASMKPEVAANVASMHALAPVAYVRHIKSPIRLLAPFSHDVEFLARLLGVGEFLPQNKILHYLAKYGCELLETEKEMCENLLFILCGYDKPQFNMSILPALLSHTPAGASTQTLIHYAQMIRSGKFQQFDYGKYDNFKEYRAAQPPAYDLSKVNVSVNLMYASNDWLASTQDVDDLYKTLQSKKKKYLVPLNTFNHLDFVLAKDVKKLLYDTILSELPRERQFDGEDNFISTF